MSTLSLPVVEHRRHAGLPPAVTSHMSGGRDQWSPPLKEAPADRVQGTWDLLQEVLDPEIPISLPELGLIYGVEFDDGIARIELTFTATACPCMEFIREDITDRLESEHWIDSIELIEVWSPPWTSERITPEGRAKLKKLGVSA
ncbi:MAG: metal-sulfur cluster assembly factor [Longimicrobiales bacterium]|nr:metal-sulfur cluster assembly factor [Longimicrobiales bacterium]